MLVICLVLLDLVIIFLSIVFSVKIIVKNFNVLLSFSLIELIIFGFFGEVLIKGIFIVNFILIVVKINVINGCYFIIVISKSSMIIVVSMILIIIFFNFFIVYVGK